MISMTLAEGVGFEPTRALASPGGFQDRCLKPLGHPSATFHARSERRFQAGRAYGLDRASIVARMERSGMRGRRSAGRRPGYGFKQARGSGPRPTSQRAGPARANMVAAAPVQNRSTNPL